MTLNMDFWSAMDALSRRIIDLSYKYKLSHIGSCLTAAPIIDSMYRFMDREKDVFVLSCGHAGLGLYAVLEKWYKLDAERLLRENGVHPNRNMMNRIWCSTGSLGCGLAIAVGFALADRDRRVYCLISDGECAEGLVWESLRFIEDSDIRNIHIAVNANGYSAYGKVDLVTLEKRLNVFGVYDIRYSDGKELPEFMRGFDAHYRVLSKEEYEKIIC